MLNWLTSEDYLLYSTRFCLMSMRGICVCDLLTWSVNLGRLTVPEQSTPTALRSVTQGWEKPPYLNVLLVKCSKIWQVIWIYLLSFRWQQISGRPGRNLRFAMEMRIQLERCWESSAVSRLHTTPRSTLCPRKCWRLQQALQALVRHHIWKLGP